MTMVYRAARVSLRALRPVQSRANVQTVLRRNMSSHGHQEKKSSDLPWIVGSAVVFVPTLGYLLMPSENTAHGSHDAHHDPHVIPVEGAVKTSEPSSDDTMTDDEGTEASNEEIKDSMKKGFASNSPKDAQAAEEHGEKYDSGAPGQTEESETDNQQKQARGVPGSRNKGTYQNDDDEEPRPTDMKDARRAARDTDLADHSPKKAEKNE